MRGHVGASKWPARGHSHRKVDANPPPPGLAVYSQEEEAHLG